MSATVGRVLLHDEDLGLKVGKCYFETKTDFRHVGLYMYSRLPFVQIREIRVVLKQAVFCFLVSAFPCFSLLLSTERQLAFISG
jgi:hypothetical protein